MDRQTPAKGSPDANVASRMSPTAGLSGLDFAKRRCRAAVGSSSVRCCVVTSSMGKGCCRATEGGGG